MLHQRRRHRKVAAHPAMATEKNSMVQYRLIPCLLSTITFNEIFLSFMIREHLKSSHLFWKRNAFQIGLTPLPPPCIRNPYRTFSRPDWTRILWHSNTILQTTWQTFNHSTISLQPLLAIFMQNWHNTIVYYSYCIGTVLWSDEHNDNYS